MLVVSRFRRSVTIDQDRWSLKQNSAYELAYFFEVFILEEQYVIVSHDQLNLHSTKSLVQTPKANVIITHGLGEHSGRYSYVVEKLNQSHLNAYTYDLRGHGKSGGHGAYVNDYRGLFIGSTCHDCICER